MNSLSTIMPPGCSALRSRRASRFTSRLIGIIRTSRHEIKLLEGNRDTLDEVELSPAVPPTVTEVVGEDSKEAYLSVWSPSPGIGVRHGRDRKRNWWTRRQSDSSALDRAILEHYSRSSGLPLLLAALPQHHSFFRQISRNPFLMPEGVDTHPDALSIEALRARAWHAIEPHYRARWPDWSKCSGWPDRKSLAPTIWRRSPRVPSQEV